MSRHRISSGYHTDVWPTMYFLNKDFQWIFGRISSESPSMRNHWIIWWELLPQHKALHWAVEGQRETKMQVGQTAALYLSLSLKLRLSLSLSLSLVGDKERQRCKVANGGAVFVFVYVFDAAFVVVFVAVFGGLWRFSCQIKGIFMTHSSLWHLFDHLQKPLAFPSLSYPARAARWER